MKTQLTILLLFIISLAFSQSEPTNHKFSIDIMTGFNSGAFGNTNPPKKDDNGKMRVKYVAKFGYKFPDVIIHQSFSSKFSGGLQVGYNAFKIANGTNTFQEKMSAFSISAGPEYKIINRNKFSMLVYGRIGTSFLSIPETKLNYPDSNVVTDKFEKSSKNAFEGKIGTNFSFPISNKISFIINTEYATNLNNPVGFKTRDVSSAVRDGNINEELAVKIPFVEQKAGFSSISVNLGLSIGLGAKIERKRPGRTKYANVLLKKSNDSPTDKPLVNNPCKINNTQDDGQKKPHKKLSRLDVILERVPATSIPNVWFSMPEKSLAEMNNLQGEAKKMYLAGFVSNVINHLYYWKAKEVIKKKEAVKSMGNDGFGPCFLYGNSKGNAITIDKGRAKYNVYFSTEGRKGVEKIILKFKKENDSHSNPSFQNGEDENGGGGFCYRQLTFNVDTTLEPLPEEDIPFCMDATETSSE